MREQTTYNQAQQGVEHRNRLRNDPSNHPKYDSDRNPRSNRQHGLFLHLIGASEDSDIDVFSCDMSVDHTGDNDLFTMSDFV
jgi:hypothetical protein